MSVRTERRGHALVVTIDRPEARNAVDAAVAKGIEAAIDLLETDGDLWVGILTGVPPAFSAGADLKAVQRGEAGLSTERGGFGGFTSRLRAKPVIAAVDGPALAGGAELALAADLVVASTRATFGIPEVKRCLVAGAGGLYRMARKLPLNVAMECALTGDPITAERAAALGLVNQVVEDGGTLEAALELAGRIAANAPLAVRESRRVLLATMGEDDGEAQAVSDEAVRTVTATADFREGVAAFVEKRAPRWTGS